MAETPSLVLVGERTVIESGNSRMVTIPPEVLDGMGLDAGDDVSLVYDRKKEQLILEESTESVF